MSEEVSVLKWKKEVDKMMEITFALSLFYCEHLL